MNIVFVPTIIFLTFVAPLWLLLHYRYKSKMIKGISPQEVNDVEDMLESLDKLIDRVETLEEILDEEHPQWRESTKNRK